MKSVETTVVYGQSKKLGIYAVASAVNAIAANGAKNISVSVRIMIPMHAFKSRINTMEKNIKLICKEKGIVLKEIISERNPVITQCMVIASAWGMDKCTDEVMADAKDIILTKWIGMEGMLRIADEKEEDLRKRFAPGFIKQIHSHEAQIFALEEVWKARELGATRIWQVGVGGILAALWNVAKEMESGIEIDLKKLEVRQETIEVCEYFRLNPYQLTSTGSMLILAEDGEVMAEALRETGVQATVIGRLTDNNDKIIRNGEEVRYIDRPAPDEIMKIYGGEDRTC